ncbi:MAG: spore cortex biosynthesis protein YabQ [Lachnospiraceae bacterium]|nr:spore cortex biosynthesis protein YabQ [Lachnospiraceae bacterium]
MASFIYDEVHLFLACMLLGAALALLYDGIRIIRMLIHHWDFVVDVEDLCFWLFTAWMVFYTLFAYNRGALRGYAFLGLFLGFLLYALTVSRQILKMAAWIVPYWHRGSKFLQKPFVFLGRHVRKGLKNIQTQVKMAIKGR